MSQEATQSEQTLTGAWQYSPNSRFYDEATLPKGQVRPHWQAVVDALAAVGHLDLARRWQEGRRLMRDIGITYNVYGDPKSAGRPWPLDPIPQLLAPAEWSAIEAGIIQRAKLLNTMLADLYGRQQLLRSGLLPAELVFANPAFLRPCCGIEPPGGVWIHVYAADIARSPDGRWWVLSDRTQAPSGAGYALENRLITTRVLPDVFGSVHVHRLAGYFQSYKDALLRLMPRHRENPRVVLLTPGPFNETYFEHAYLARYLGYTLVEGGDLTVRDNRVFLKTLGGLLPVDVILRRQDDSFCDPLELRGDSMLGVPGLTEAVRSGHVAIANALGSGLAESPASAAFLPALCRQLLDEELKLPTVATWWCGQQEPFAYVTENLGRLVIKPAFSNGDHNPTFGAKLSVAERQKLVEKMRAAPERYVAQEQVSLSTVPFWHEDRLYPRHFVLRVYAVASGDSYTVMPGGLTRVSSSLDSLVVSMQSGGGSKDTWVLADGPTPHVSLLNPPSMALGVNRATFDLPSRVADNLFWLGRYTERIEAAVRIARAILPRFSLESEPLGIGGLRVGLELLGTLGYLSTEAADLHSAESNVLSMVYDSASRHSLGSSIRQVRHSAWLLRDRISADAWRILNGLDKQFSGALPPGALRTSSAHDRLNDAVITLSAFGGLVMESMTRGDGWRFLDIGRRLERSIQISELLRHGIALQSAEDRGTLEMILELADSSITYRSRYLTSMQADLVLDLLLVDEANPRSIAFQLARLREHVEHLPESQSLLRRPEEARLALSLLSAVQLADVQELVKPDEGGSLPGLENLLNRLVLELRGLSETLTRTYFNLAIPSRQRPPL
jgi:uncharacterized circularly permuted ATP-grasp superfamily protein/uncharacterized alpha-E superfamily protein